MLTAAPGHGGGRVRLAKSQPGEQVRARRTRSPSRANESAATTARSPPARTGRSAGKYHAAGREPARRRSSLPPCRATLPPRSSWRKGRGWGRSPRDGRLPRCTIRGPFSPRARRRAAAAGGDCYRLSSCRPSPYFHLAKHFAGCRNFLPPRRRSSPLPETRARLRGILPTTQSVHSGGMPMLLRDAGLPNGVPHRRQTDGVSGDAPFPHPAPLVIRWHFTCAFRLPSACRGRAVRAAMNPTGSTQSGDTPQ